MRVEDVGGGTNRAGVPTAVFAMPAGMRMRYDLPAPAIADCVTGYAIYASDGREPLANWYLPAPPMITILLDAGSVRLSIRDGPYADVRAVSLWGSTRRAFRTVTHGGVSVGIGLTAAGWARLTPLSASGFCDKVGDLGAVVGAGLAARLFDTVNALGSDAEIGPALDAALPALFRHDHPRHGATRALETLILTNGVIGIADVADRLGIDTVDLRRMAVHYFGMPAKTLLSRARFVRSLATWLLRGEPPFYAGIDSSYFDTSHFLRDAQTYLGMTPRRFAAEPTTYLRASLRVRAAVIGAPAHALHEGRDPVSA